METPAQVADRLGIPQQVLPELLEVEAVADLMVLAREDPDLAPEAIMANLELPVCDPGGLDVPRLLADARTQRLRRERLEDIGRRGDGSTRPRDRVEGSGAMLGAMEREKRKAQRYLEVIETVDSLLNDSTNGSLPAVSRFNAAVELLKKAQAP